MITMTGEDFLYLIGKDTELRYVASTGGGEYAGPCPFCGGEDRFRVWLAAGRYWCRQCDRKGDAIQYLREREGLGYREACERLGVEPKANVNYVNHVNPRSRPKPKPTVSPSPEWQKRGKALVEECAKALWADTGVKALAWLRGRWLTDTTIREACLGLNLRERWEKREAWGLDAGDKKSKVWIPRGVVIPLFCGGVLWRVNIRRPLTAQQEAGGEAKYIQIAGSKAALYNADTLSANTPAVLVEGEIDALTIAQYAGDLATAVATGSTHACRRLQWISKLALSPLVLVSFDADKAGEEASEYWIKVLPNAKRWRPYWQDANAMSQSGASIRAWVEAGLKGTEMETRVEVGKTGVGVGEIFSRTVELMTETKAFPSPAESSEEVEAPPVSTIETRTPANRETSYLANVAPPELQEILAELISDGFRGAADTIAGYFQKGVPVDVCVEAAQLWQSDNPENWKKARELLDTAYREGRRVPR